VKNVAKGVFNASGDIDGMFMQFMELVKKSS
jgi:hypothetical protein